MKTILLSDSNPGYNLNKIRSPDTAGISINTNNISFGYEYVHVPEYLVIWVVHDPSVTTFIFTILAISSFNILTKIGGNEYGSS